MWGLLPIGLLASWYGMGWYAHYTGCTYVPEDKLIELARTEITKRIELLVRTFDESPTDIQSGSFVLFSTFDDPLYPVGLTYQTPGGQVIDLEFSSTCRINLYFPHRIQRLENAISVRDLRTGQPFSGR